MLLLHSCAACPHTSTEFVYGWFSDINGELGGQFEVWGFANWLLNKMKKCILEVVELKSLTCHLPAHVLWQTLLYRKKYVYTL